MPKTMHKTAGGHRPGGAGPGRLEDAEQDREGQQAHARQDTDHRSGAVVPLHEQRRDAAPRRPRPRATRRPAGASGPCQLPGLRPRGDHRVAQQHRDRHRADAAGHRRDQPRALGGAARTRRRRPGPSSVRLMPTSITTAPSLTQSPRTSRGPADGGDQHVGAAAHLGEVARARVADRDGGVARRAAARRPACRRGPSGRRRPPRRPRARRRGGAAAPSPRRACTGAGPGGPWPAGRRRSASGRRRPCAGSMISVSAPPSTCGGVGSWSRMPDTRGSSLSSRSSASTSCVARVVRAAGGRSPRCRPRPTPSACRPRRPRRRGRRRPARSPGRAARGRPRPTPRPPRATSARTCCAIALPSMSPAAIGRGGYLPAPARVGPLR